MQRVTDVGLINETHTGAKAIRVSKYIKYVIPLFRPFTSRPFKLPTQMRSDSRWNICHQFLKNTICYLCTGRNGLNGLNALMDLISTCTVRIDVLRDIRNERGVCTMHIVWRTGS